MDYTKVDVDVDPPMPSTGEFESLTPQSETILPSPQPDEADWGDEEVDKIVETEIEDLQSQVLPPTEASHTSRLPQPRILLSKTLEETSEAEPQPTPLATERTPLQRISEKRGISERAKKRAAKAARKPGKELKEMESQTPLVKALPSQPPSSSTKPPTTLTPRPPSTPPPNTSRQPIRPLSPLRSADPAPEEVRNHKEPDWKLVTSKNEFLRLATRNLSMDPASMEGVNFHISSYFYVKEGGWTCSHPAQLSSCSLRRDASEKSRWACFACARRGEGRMTPLHLFRTSSEQLEHFFLNDATDSMWDFARKGSELGVTASELAVAIIGKDLRTTPLPTGQPMSLVPTVLPSHPLGHSKLVTKAPWFLTIAPWWYESEKGLPWFSEWSQEEEAVEQKVEPPTTYFGWELFVEEFEEGNHDIFVLLCSSASSYEQHQSLRLDWHKANAGTQDIRSISCGAAVEEHSLMLLLLKLVLTKGDAGSVPKPVSDRAMSLLKTHSPDFVSTMHTFLGKLNLFTGATQFYAQALMEYSSSVAELSVPVNLWKLPSPPGSQLSFGDQLLGRKK